MDDPLLQSLLAALQATPENVDLRVSVIRLFAREQRPMEAAEHARTLDVSQVDDEATRLMVAECFESSDAFSEALPWLEAQEPKTWLLKAKVLLALERRDDAREAYDLAVSENAALEDASLSRALSAKVTSIESAGGAKLKVIANDDTDVLELTRLLQPPEETVTFSDVGGLNDVKKSIHRKIILPFQKPSLFERFKKRAGGGILLYGPPGCGKTLLARATAGEVNAPFMSVAVADVLDMYIGESERKLQALFDKARREAPSVLFFDEVEALGGKRQHTREATASKLVSQFLSEMDGFAQNNQGVLILGATNVPWAVDPAFRRPGRFDRVVFIPPPDREARLEILGKLINERPTEGVIDADFLAKKTSGYSGADLRELIETAVDEAIEASIDAGREIDLTMEHLRHALRDRSPTTLEWLTTARNYARYANEGGQYDDVLAFLKKHANA